MEEFPFKERYGINDLLAIVAILRSENGCPWDREQTHKSIRTNFIEEAYEAVEAIDCGDKELLKEELGDVLLQIALHVQMEAEIGSFDFDGVCDGISKKLIIRHPHVFGDVKADTSREVLENWDSIKRVQKGQETYAQSLRTVPKLLPGLMKSQKIQSRAAKSGFDYRNTDEAFNDLKSEVDELSAALSSGDASSVFEELGDLIFSCVNVARLEGIDAEDCLVKSSDKFIERFEKTEQLAQEEQIDMKSAEMALLNKLWEKAKQS